MTYEELLVAITDNMYKGLFGFGIERANELLGLPQSTDEETRRDHLGRLALEAFSLLEGQFASTINDLSQKHMKFTEAQYLDWSLNMAKVAAEYYRQLVPSGERLLIANYADGVQ